MGTSLTGWHRLLIKAGLLVLVLALFPAPASAQTLRVVKDQDCLRDQAQFFGQPVALVKQGDQLKQLGMKGDWYQVEFQGKQGWIHQSAVSTRKVSLSALRGTGTAQAATADEVALAGKGFTPEVEAGYREKNPNLNYAAVDRVESFQVPEAQLRKFITEGGLRP
ncbi:MAG: SH3 domain-containing protein [Desulfobacca sp.]|nr:SH3 domain-containing protein [Desulfobacca sp.]